MSLIGTEQTETDVRCAVANGGKADFAWIDKIDAIGAKARARYPTRFCSSALCCYRHGERGESLIVRSLFPTWSQFLGLSDEIDEADAFVVTRIFNLIGTRSGAGYNDAQKWADGLQGRPVGICIIASLQGSLEPARLRLTQARSQSPPGLTPSHTFSMLDWQTSQISESFVSLVPTAGAQGLDVFLNTHADSIVSRLHPGTLRFDVGRACLFY